jgi:3',5'-cyclic AMP phosphodiesterase CpdA
MRIVHLSDLHLTLPEHGAIAHMWTKRWTGYASWRRHRRWQHRREVLDRLASAVQSERPDRIVITGDLTQIGLPEEIAAAHAWLQTLAPPERVCLVPGNHDLYAHDSWPALRCEWADYLHLAGDDAGASRAAPYPVVRELDGVAIVCANSALPTPILCAGGRLGASQRQRLEQSLAALHARGLLCCLLIHHPPLPAISSWRKALSDAGALATILTRHAPALVLHGHLHRNKAYAIGATRIFATASASSAMAQHPASYRVFDCERDPRGWRIAMTLKQADPGGTAFATTHHESWLQPQPVGG